MALGDAGPCPFTITVTTHGEDSDSDDEDNDDDDDVPPSSRSRQRKKTRSSRMSREYSQMNGAFSPPLSFRSRDEEEEDFAPFWRDASEGEGLQRTISRQWSRASSRGFGQEEEEEEEEGEEEESGRHERFTFAFDEPPDESSRRTPISSFRRATFGDMDSYNALITPRGGMGGEYGAYNEEGEDSFSEASSLHSFHSNSPLVKEEEDALSELSEALSYESDFSDIVQTLEHKLELSFPSDPSSSLLQIEGLANVNDMKEAKKRKKTKKRRSIEKESLEASLGADFLDLFTWET